MQKNLSDCEKVLLKNFEVRQYLVKMSEIVKKYFPDNNTEAEIWCSKMFEGFKILIPQADGLIDAVLNVCFWQQSSEDGSFSFTAPYKLDHIEFHSIWDKVSQVDAYYNYCGNWVYSGWVTEDKIAPDQVTSLCVELFTLFKDLTITL
ncbi:hypothetical protein [Anabaena catenula]|uniref:Uncharacterized protein n=1 Tax=Anabaena catenula FACHB-362 TaxID=2692877 RepID=A0ABR8IXR2_9NOST|nr:hypothetical protein [Anabaena catenula]MBD2690801.1 hypothetical protein [Anabaena catenula FACHB-362]